MFVFFQPFFVEGRLNGENHEITGAFSSVASGFAYGSHGEDVQIEGNLGELGVDFFSWSKFHGWSTYPP